MNCVIQSQSTMVFHNVPLSNVFVKPNEQRLSLFRLCHGEKRCIYMNNSPFYINDYISLDLGTVIKGKSLFVLIPRPYSSGMCGVLTDFLVSARDEVGNADIWMFVEVH